MLNQLEKLESLFKNSLSEQDNHDAVLMLDTAEIDHGKLDIDLLNIKRNIKSMKRIEISLINYNQVTVIYLIKQLNRMKNISTRVFTNEYQIEIFEITLKGK